MHRYTVANAIVVQMLKANYLCSLPHNYGAIAKIGNISKYFLKKQNCFLYCLLSLCYHKYKILFTNIIRFVFTKVLYLLRK
jgi:hypothetical protein